MRIQRLWVLGIPLLVGAVSAAVTERKPEAACVVAGRWVKGHSASLPSTLADISMYTLVYRKAIFAALPRATQLSLWHEQNRYYIRSERLTEEQREFLARVDGELDQYFGPEKAAAFEKRYMARIRDLFGPLAREVFANLGVSVPETNPANMRKAATDGICNCSRQSDWCLLTGPGCQSHDCRQVTGCGTFWAYTCDGCCEGLCDSDS
jgi:hypothetical protein